VIIREVNIAHNMVLIHYIGWNKNTAEWHTMNTNALRVQIGIEKMYSRMGLRLNQDDFGVLISFSVYFSFIFMNFCFRHQQWNKQN
jgi:hypothetical protein